MLLLSTIDGVYAFDDKELRNLCCRGVEIRDSILLNGLITCGSFGVKLNDKLLNNNQCWGLDLFEGDVLAYLEGPKLYSFNERSVILDLTKLGEEKDWYFPHGLPHFTSIMRFKGNVVISVEEGNLLVGKSIKEVLPIDYFEDMHNLFTFGKYLLIATANGIEATQDLKYFMKVAYGYSHGIVNCGNTLYAQIMDKKPLLTSRNGTFWDSIQIELEPPSFGTTNIACDKDKLYYASENLYVIENKQAKKILEVPYTVKVRSL